MTEREELARVLFCNRWEGCGHWELIARWYGWDDARALAYETADAILASPWLARVKAEARAEGLEQAAGIAERIGDKEADLHNGAKSEAFRENYAGGWRASGNIAAAIRAAKETT